MFIDQLLTNLKTAKDVKESLRGSVVIDASNVGDYYLQNIETIHDAIKSLPNLAPPFEKFFLEFKTPHELKASYATRLTQDWPSRWGILCGSQEIIETGSTIKWALCLKLFVPHKVLGELGPIWLWNIRVDALGGPEIIDGKVQYEYMPLGVLKVALQLSSPQEREELLQTMAGNTFGMIFPALLAISFMHCKNVVLRKEVPPVVQQTVKQKRQRVQPHQPVTSHVLDIEPMKQILKTEGQSESVGLQRALHICRGHFSTYTEDHKLFGKYAGTFWIPQHVRGSQEVGYAAKDYRIKMK